MLAKFIASIALMVISFGVSLGNYWFVFGLWPKNWMLFFLFAFLQLLILGAHAAVGKSK